MDNWCIISGSIGGVLVFLAKYIEISAITYLSIQFLVAGLILLPFINFGDLSQNWLVLLGTGVALVLSTIFGIRSLRTAPNPGFSQSIYTIISIGVLYFLSFAVLGLGLTQKKILGILLGIISVIFIIT